MSLARLQSAAFSGLDAVNVEVEVDVSQAGDGFSFITVGLPDIAVKESKDRVLAGIKHSGFSIGTGLHCTVNLAPGNLKKEGPLYDLPIAIGLLNGLKQIDVSALSDYLIVGEMALSGDLRPIRGALSAAMLAKANSKKGILLPASNAKEAASVPGIAVIPIKHLRDVVTFLKAPEQFPKMTAQASSSLFRNARPPVDFSEIKGQAHVKRAAEIAAAGAHNILLCGPPGSGKTMIAKALLGIIPDLTIEEALETTKVHSIAGLLPEGKSIVTERPFRSPHHTVSYAGLIGGGTNPRPGEVSLAHHGILFLDELPEFSRATLEVLRQPLEDRKVTISRANGRFTFPTDFICIAAMNPCPCGNLGHPDKVCSDSEMQISRYRSKISGPLLDRIDMHIDVPALRYRDIIDGRSCEPSSEVRKRVEGARQRQHKRFKKVKTNAQTTPQDLKKYCPLDQECNELLRHAIDDLGISVRAYHRIIKVALTIADLEGKETIGQDHLMEAISYRTPSKESQCNV